MKFRISGNVFLTLFLSIILIAPSTSLKADAFYAGFHSSVYDWDTAVRSKHIEMMNVTQIQFSSTDLRTLYIKENPTNSLVSGLDLYASYESNMWKLIFHAERISGEIPINASIGSYEYFEKYGLMAQAHYSSRAERRLQSMEFVWNIFDTGANISAGIESRSRKYLAYTGSIPASQTYYDTTTSSYASDIALVTMSYEYTRNSPGGFVGIGYEYRFDESQSISASIRYHRLEGVSRFSMDNSVLSQNFYSSYVFTKRAVDTVTKETQFWINYKRNISDYWTLTVSYTEQKAGISGNFRDVDKNSLQNGGVGFQVQNNPWTGMEYSISMVDISPEMYGIKQNGYWTRFSGISVGFQYRLSSLEKKQN